MESNSKRQRILCSERSYKLLKEQAPEFPAKKRGAINVKGKGEMTVYWVGALGGKNKPVELEQAAVKHVAFASDPDDSEKPIEQ